MDQKIGMPRLAKAYAVLMPLSALSVIVQAILFGGWYSEVDAGYLDAHQALGAASVAVVLVCLVLAHLARFPREALVGHLTDVLAVLWVVQYMLGQYSEDQRWFSFLHIPLAFIIFGLAVVASGRAHRSIAGNSDSQS